MLPRPESTLELQVRHVFRLQLVLILQSLHRNGVNIQFFFLSVYVLAATCVWM